MIVKKNLARMAVVAVIAVVTAQCSFGQLFGGPKKPSGPWMDKSLTPDQRADLVLSGCAILDAICATWPVGRLRVADRGIREGILFDLMHGRSNTVP